MKYRVHVGKSPSGDWSAYCLDPRVSARGKTQEEALEGLRGEIRLMVEWCPCTAVSDSYVELEVVSTPCRP